MKEIFTRHPGNPIITTDDIPGGCRSVFNPGAVFFNGKYILMMTVRSIDNLPKLWVATSCDGINFKAEDHPVDLPKDERYSKYEFCNYDPRITKIDGEYYVTYAISGFFGCRIGILKTADFQKFERVSFVHEVGNHNVVLFPEKIRGMYACLDRPQHGSIMNMWVSYSPDLIHWGESDAVITSREGFWDGGKIGAGIPPIKTPKGWLEIYHGVRESGGSPMYQLGCILMDLEDPSKVIARGRYPILYPKETHELTGFIPNVVFTAGAILEEKTGELKLYYGACDQCICLATAKLDDIIEACYQE
jgi:predicted GH43/DUF377 family glycosyl hydrolase